MINIEQNQTRQKDYAIVTFREAKGKDNFIARKYLEINSAKITISPYKFVKKIVRSLRLFIWKVLLVQWQKCKKKVFKIIKNKIHSKVLELQFLQPTTCVKRDNFV